MCVVNAYAVIGSAIKRPQDALTIWHLANARRKVGMLCY